MRVEAEFSQYDSAALITLTGTSVTRAKDSLRASGHQREVTGGHEDMMAEYVVGGFVKFHLERRLRPSLARRRCLSAMTTAI